MKFTRSIAFRIIFSVVPIITLFTILYLVVIYYVTNGQINEQIDHKMRENLAAASLEIQNELIKNAGVSQSMAVYAETCSIETIESGGMREFLLKIIPSNKNTVGGGIWYEPHTVFPEEQYFGPYVHVGDDGQSIYEEDYASTVDYHNTDWYYNGSLSFGGEPVWSDVYHDPVPDITMITSTVAFFDRDGGMLGVATADMSLGDIQEVARSITVEETGRAFILGAGGEYISYLDDSRGIEQRIQEDENTALASLGATVLAGGEGIASLVLDGVEKRAYYTTLDNTGWILTILIDSDEIASSSFDLVILMAIVPILGLILSVFSIISVANHLRRIVNKVNSFAGLATSGDLSKRIEIAEHDEFGIMEERLNQMMDSMSEMNRHSQEMLEMAQQASQAKTDFLSNMSHEMRTPMNAIIGMTAIAKSSGEVERKDYCLEKIEDASVHLLGVINDILDMSKIEANKFELSGSEFRFEKMLQNVVNVMNFRIGEKQQEFTIRLDRDIPAALVADEQRLSQVITNLLSNAVKFTPEEGSIHLSAKLLEEAEDLCTIQIEVTDSGIGISDEQQANLFRSFEQADSSISRKYGGTGLGLAISKRIVEMMGGTIWVESKLGQGSTFAFTFQARRGTEEPGGLLRPGINWNNIQVLAVDDSQEVREYLSEIAQQLGFQLDVASGAAQAIGLIEQKGQYDVYFVDWRMPEMDGMELSRRIKDGHSDHSVVIMISAVEWNLIESDAREAGVDKFLAKPLMPSMIADCISECIGLNSQREQGRGGAANPDDLTGYHVLLVEDVEINREIVLALLEPTGLAVDCAENGVQALEMVKGNPERYHLIFMDVQMPEMDGYEATRQIRRLDSKVCDIPIIAMTANAFREDVEKCLAAGMNDHLAKPLNLDDVMEKLRRYLPQNIQNKE